MGRQTILDRQTIDGFSAEVREGLPLIYVCDIMRIPRSNYVQWMEAGQADENAGRESVYREFSTAVKQAYAEFVKDTKAVIRKGQPGWQGTAWWLERTNRDFMPKQQIQADDDGRVTVVIGGKAKDVKPRNLCEDVDLKGR